MYTSFKYIPKDQRKKILLICDDIRVHSGVATVAKEMVMHTCQHFNWTQIAGAIKHPEKGKRFDLSEATDKETGLTDSSISLYLKQEQILERVFVETHNHHIIFF